MQIIMYLPSFVWDCLATRIVHVIIWIFGIISGFRHFTLENKTRTLWRTRATTSWWVNSIEPYLDWRISPPDYRQSSSMLILIEGKGEVLSCYMWYGFLYVCVLSVCVCVCCCVSVKVWCKCIVYCVCGLGVRCCEWWWCTRANRRVRPVLRSFGSAVRKCFSSFLWNQSDCTYKPRFKSIRVLRWVVICVFCLDVVCVVYVCVYIYIYMCDLRVLFLDLFVCVVDVMNVMCMCWLNTKQTNRANMRRLHSSTLDSYCSRHSHARSL